MSETFNRPTTHDALSDEEVTQFGPLKIAGRHAWIQRRLVLVARLQAALGLAPFEQTEPILVDSVGAFGPQTNAALERVMGGGPWATFEDRLQALGELELGGELETIIIQHWKTTGVVAA